MTNSMHCAIFNYFILEKKNHNINHFFFLSVDLSKMYLDTFCPREREILSVLASGYEINN